MPRSTLPLSHSEFTTPLISTFILMCRQAPGWEGRAPASLMEVVLPRNSFWVLMSPKCRGQILGSTWFPFSAASWLCRGAVKVIQKASWTFSLAQGEGSSRPGCFHWKKRASFCSRDKWAAMKFYNSHNKPIIKIVTKKRKKNELPKKPQLNEKTKKSFKLPVVSC